MGNVWSESVFSVRCFSKLTQGIREQQLFLAGEEDVEPTKLRILLINCQSDNVTLQLELAINKTIIQTIIFLYANNEHFAIAETYVDKLNFPLLFVEERCEVISNMISKYAELMAEVCIEKKNRGVPSLSLGTRSNFLEPFQQVSELLRTDSMKPRSIQEDPRLFFEILKIIRISKEDDNLKRTKVCLFIYQLSFSDLYLHLLYVLLNRKLEGYTKKDSLLI